MFCPQCGNPVLEEGASFCKYCGCNLEPYRKTTAETVTISAARPELPAAEQEEALAFTYVMDQEGGSRWDGEPAPVKKRRTGRKVAAVAVVLLLLASAGLVLVGSGTGNDDGSPDYTVISSDSTETVTLTNASQQMVFYLGNAFYTDSGVPYMTATLNQGYLVISLSSAVTAASTSYTWQLTENTGNLTFDSVTKTSGYLTWSSPQYGDYTVTVECTDSEGNITEYIGTLNVEVYYAWTYDGDSYAMAVDISYQDYLDSSAATYTERTARSVTKWATAPDYVVVDSTVQSIADQLTTLYTEMNGSSALDQSFADFTLAFVQICYTYQYDDVLYGQEEYWAYPLETIFNGGGDCEDTSILCAAIFTAEGFQAAVAVLPGHAIAGVALASYVNPSYSSSKYEVLSQSVSGDRYYACETTYDSYTAVGLEPLTKSGAYSQYLGHYVAGYGTYGFYPVTA